MELPQLSGMPGGGGNLDPSENIFSVSKCAICSSLIVFKGGTLTLSGNSFPGQPLVAKVPQECE